MAYNFWFLVKQPSGEEANTRAGRVDASAAVSTIFCVRCAALDISKQPS